MGEGRSEVRVPNMNNPFYNTPARIAALQAAAASWLGTPFMGNANVKGAGVSCQTLAANLYIESGFLPADFAIVKAPMDWSHAHTDSLIVKAMAALPQLFAPIGPFVPANKFPFQPGDFLGFKIGGCVHHCAVLLKRDGQIIHSLRGHGTVYSTILDASYLTRLTHAWRPIA